MDKKDALVDEGGSPGRTSLVLYCLIRRKTPGRGVEFLMQRNRRGWTFPPTKFRPGEDLYSALVRPMEEDLGLPAGSYFPERELEMIPNDVRGPRYKGLTQKWYLYPVDVSLTAAATARLNKLPENRDWMTLDEVAVSTNEPNIQAIVRYLRETHPNPLSEVRDAPSMDALASAWAHRNESGVRLVRRPELQEILAAGSRAFNLRVADPYLPYQKQGLGFTWSFFTHKNVQDIHVHSLPAVEVYGVIEGRLQVWHKPMNQRGVRTWQKVDLEPGDWLEVEPLHCHFACWVEPEGLGTVFKAASEGELAGVGKLGVSGKTTCDYCSAVDNCAVHPVLAALQKEYQKPFEERDYKTISSLTQETVSRL